MSLHLHDATGQLVLPPTPWLAGGQLQLPSNLAPGVYPLEVHQGDVLNRRRLTKQ